MFGQTISEGSSVQMDVFASDKPFFKGNLHCHTTLSDGRLTPEEVKQFYRDRGYDFLTLTDHRLFSEPTHMEDGLLVLKGMEADYFLPGEVVHLVCFGMEESVHSEDEMPLPRNPQRCIDLIRKHGGRVILAHPAWSLNTLATMTGLYDVTTAEIYNSASTTPWNGDRGDSSSLLDVAAAHGKFFNFVASDDSHWYNGEAGRSFTMIQADELTRESLLEAFDLGRFYCSQGPLFEQISLEDGKITVRCSPVDKVVFYSNAPWAFNRCASGHDLTEASYDLSVNADRHETHVRVQLIDSQGRSAWSNPIIL